MSTRDRYANCDQTCTTDCGACKGKPPVRVGTIFARSWGYDQTNVDFYRVLGFTPSGKSVRVVKVWQRAHDDCHVVPTEQAVEDGEVLTKRLVGSDARPAITVTHYGDHAYLWNGRPMYRTPHGYGH